MDGSDLYSFGDIPKCDLNTLAKYFGLLKPTFSDSSEIDIFLSDFRSWVAIFNLMLLIYSEGDILVRACILR